ncbi:hypothetical protein MHZ36_12400 [Staphylococcus sp. ACRSN]|uniref:hypothetical protein n=1 Tax=Staphylococcus sp. ACRSN TaxID=2918214 RepID=UPI001EF2A5CC|nr:hypothetical protein [Staphylococcus sp. ACRSN]
MNKDSLTHILLLIAGILIIINGIFAFESSTPMIIISLFFIVVGSICTVFASILIYKKIKS